MENATDFCFMGATQIRDTSMDYDTTDTPTTGEETGRELRDRRGDSSRNIERRWPRLFGVPFSVYDTYDAETIATYEAAYPIQNNDVKLKRPYPVRIPKAGSTPGAKALPVVSPGKKWLLWLCFALSAACSIPNMFSVMEAIKGNEILAGIVTAAFTIAPFLLIGYGVRGASHLVVYVVIGVEVFCNAAGFYGGMTGLSHSLYTAPTLFLHMVTSMTNSGNEGTALLLAMFMAICIALLAVVPVYEIGKNHRETGIKTDKK